MPNRPTWGWLVCLVGGALLAAAAEPPTQYILINRAPGATWHQNRPESFTPEGFREITGRLADAEQPTGRVRVGLAFIFSYLNATSPEVLTASLDRFLKLAAATDTPVLVQLDGEQWWDARPDLWNWWDPAQPGYDPANRFNVEWSGWTPDRALKIAWRNWGRQIRVRPPPNLMSPIYRDACHTEMARLVPRILDWWRALPAAKQDLFVGIKLGWESSIGVNAFYYPDGNALLDRPAKEDPTTGLKVDELPGRGVQAIGYAAVKTAGLATSAALREADLAEVVRRHLEDLCRQAAELGVPRDRLFTHGGGWAKGEWLYQAALNQYSCPGWSSYRHARDPKRDRGVQAALAASDAPGWAAVEWLLQGTRTREEWRAALRNTLADRRCRFVTVFNWGSIRHQPTALAAIRDVTSEPAAP